MPMCVCLCFFPGFRGFPLFVWELPLNRYHQKKKKHSSDVDVGIIKEATQMKKKDYA